MAKEKKMATFVLLKAVYVSLLAGLFQLDVQATDSDGRIHDNDDAFIANTTYGMVRGKKTENPYGEVIQYLGIPYAKPPVGDLRFSAPSPPEPWTDVWDASSNRPICVQHVVMSDKIVGSEDCLYLNVYIPTNISDDPLSVMLFVHGGAFEYGAGHIFDGSRLASQGVVVVNFNYRLGVFGYLSTEDEVIPGNFGMLDQVLVLKWVQSNIVYFGGDPSKVTLFGHSAGAVSVSLHLLSPLSEGLFARAIIESGSSLSPWAITHPATATSPNVVSRWIGARVGCWHRNSANFINCIRQVDQYTLYNAYIKIKMISSPSSLIMTPIVEKTFGFLPDLPINLLRHGKLNNVNTLRGFNSHEMAFAQEKFSPSMNLRQFRTAIMGTMEGPFSGGLKPYTITTTDKDLFVDAVVEAYNVTEDSKPGYIRDQAIQASSNLQFVGPTMNEVRFFVANDSSDSGGKSDKPSHYVYRFNYRPSFSMQPSWVGASHGDEIIMVLGNPPNVGHIRVQPSQMDRIMAEQTMTWWSNFAKTGNPNSVETLKLSDEWKPYTTTNDLLLEIDSNSSMVAYGRPEVRRLSLKLTQKIDTDIDEEGSVIG